MGTVSQVGGQSGSWSWSGTAPDESSPYTVTITATNADQSVSSTSFSVQGSDVAPTVSANQSSVTQPEFTAVSNSGTFADVDDAVTLSTDVAR